MQECQEKARDLMMKPGAENDSYATSKAEKLLISCMEKQVNEHIKMLKPMKDRYVGRKLASSSSFACLYLLFVLNLFAVV